MRLKFAYPLKHWLTTLVLAPALFVLYVSITEWKSPWDSFLGKALVATTAISFVFSLPAFVVYLVVYNVVIRRWVNGLAIKILLNMFAICTALAALWAIKKNVMEFAIYFSIAIIASSSFYKIEKVATKTQNLL
jgi:hypothetical protein